MILKCKKVYLPWLRKYIFLCASNADKDRSPPARINDLHKGQLSACAKYSIEINGICNICCGWVLGAPTGGSHINVTYPSICSSVGKNKRCLASSSLTRFCKQNISVEGTAGFAWPRAALPKNCAAVPA